VWQGWWRLPPFRHRGSVMRPHPHPTMTFQRDTSRFGDGPPEDGGSAYPAGCWVVGRPLRGGPSTVRHSYRPTGRLHAPVSVPITLVAANPSGRDQAASKTASQLRVGRPRRAPYSPAVEQKRTTPETPQTELPPRQTDQICTTASGDTATGHADSRFRFSCLRPLGVSGGGPPWPSPAHRRTGTSSGSAYRALRDVGATS